MDDVIAVKDTSRLMAADLHGATFGNTRPHHVPHGCSPEIVEEFSRQTSLSTSPIPCFVKSPKRLSIAMEHIGKEVLPCCTPTVNDVSNHPGEHKYPCLCVFGSFKPQPHHPIFKVAPQKQSNLIFAPGRIACKTGNIFEMLRQT